VEVRAMNRDFESGMTVGIFVGAIIALIVRALS
jgi:hypothetical protein